MTHRPEHELQVLSNPVAMITIQNATTMTPTMTANGRVVTADAVTARLDLGA